MVEMSTDRKLKAIWSDNGGEYTSVEFSTFSSQKEFIMSSQFPSHPSKME